MAIIHLHGTGQVTGLTHQSPDTSPNRAVESWASGKWAFSYSALFHLLTFCCLFLPFSFQLKVTGDEKENISIKKNN